MCCGLQVGVPRSVREECHKLGELGWLFRKVRSFTENKKLEKTAGLVVNVRWCTCGLMHTQYILYIIMYIHTYVRTYVL